MIVAQYYPLSALVSDAIVYGGLALLCLAETVALVRVPRLVGQPHWRQWLAVLPAVALLLSAACSGVMVYAYARLSADPVYAPNAVPCDGYACVAPHLQPASVAALDLTEWVNSRSVLIVAIVFGVALFGYLALAIGRRPTKAAV